MLLLLCVIFPEVRAKKYALEQRRDYDLFVLPSAKARIQKELFTRLVAITNDITDFFVPLCLHIFAHFCVPEMATETQLGRAGVG